MNLAYRDAQDCLPLLYREVAAILFHAMIRPCLAKCNVMHLPGRSRNTSSLNNSWTMSQRSRSEVPTKRAVTIQMKRTHTFMLPTVARSFPKRDSPPACQNEGSGRRERRWVCIYPDVTR